MEFVTVTKPWYEVLLLILSVSIITSYIYIYISAKREYGEKYVPIIITARTLVLAAFLIFFYNPLRSKFEYGRSLPLFAFTAGITLLLFLDRYQILNLVHFCLYGDVLPARPKKVCRLVNDESGNDEIHGVLPKKT
jgi:phosphatidylglycerophosphate synthase